MRATTHKEFEPNQDLLITHMDFEQKNPKFQKKVIITHKDFEKTPTFKKKADYHRGIWNTPSFESWSWIFVHLKNFLKFFA